MKICMLGTGSLGSTIGGTLAQGGSEVYFVDQWKEHIDKINENGLKMTDEKEDWYVKVDARTTAEGIGPVDLVIVLVKSFATKEAVSQLKETNVIGENTLVMSLQNGLGNEETIAEVVGEANVISGKTYVGGRLLSPEYIKETAVAAIQEGIDVAKAAGVKLKSEDPEYPWYAASEGLPGTFKTSILQSLELKRPTEIDFINGSVVEWGKKFGIPTPVNQTLVTCVKGIEKFLLEYEPSLKK